MSLFYHKWCVSGGKDSSAMIIRAKELGMQIDEILFADTGKEFPEVYEYLDRLEDYLSIKIRRLKPKTTWDDWFFGKSTRGKSKGKMRGWPMAVAGACWWHREAKFKPLNEACMGSKRYIGIAVDEPKRIRTTPGYVYPLSDWGWTEQDCIGYLKSKDMLAGIHTKFKRTGCYLCQKQSKASLMTLHKEYPRLWAELMRYDSHAKFPMYDLNEMVIESEAK